MNEIDESEIAALRSERAEALAERDAAARKVVRLLLRGELEQAANEIHLTEIAALKVEIGTLRMTELPVGWLAAPKSRWDALQARAERAEALIREALGCYAVAQPPGVLIPSSLVNRMTGALAPASPAEPKAEQPCEACVRGDVPDPDDPNGLSVMDCPKCNGSGKRSGGAQ